MNKAILIHSDNWEGLYVNGKLVEEGYKLNQSEERAIYFAKLARKWQFDLESMGKIYLNDRDIIWTEDVGSFPESIMEFDTIKDYKF